MPPPQRQQQQSAAAPTTSSSTANPKALSPAQNAQLFHLWKAHCRELVDVPLSSEQQDSSPKIPPHTYGFVVRLHAFFRDFLQQAMRQQAESNNSDDDTNNNDANNNNNPARLIKHPRQSALKAYAQLALVSSSSATTASDNHNQHQPQPQQQTIRLAGGRRVIALHHEDFLQELNQYECNALHVPEEFIRRESFGAFLYHMPRDAVLALGCSMALAMVTTLSTTASSNNNDDEATVAGFLDSTQIIVRFAHLQPQINMVDIKTGLVGKLLTIKGHVVKARPKRLQVATAEFTCLKCRSAQTHSFADGGRYSIPTKCYNADCRGRSFTLNRPTARYIDAQEIRLQEAQDENNQAGRTPRQIEVELSHDLVDVCRPGDIVLVAATVCAINSAVAAGQMGKRAKETSTYKLYLQGHSVTTMSETSSGSSNNARSKQQQVIYTQQQLRSIIQLCHADHRYFGLTERRAFPFDLLVRSICPAIIGHNEVKAGLLLCLLGGTPSTSIRSNSHFLIVGDPGMGKSQMLLAANQLAARSVYVGGNTSSTTGLTVTLTKEERGESGIEAGALVLADQGICCIDEFDKMAKNHQDGLLEAMEQQQVSIAKAGVVASLPARCSVLAAANPKHGSYNMGKTVAENLNMAKPILSRFDLVFILRDRADKDLDRMVSSNIMNLYRSNAGGCNSQAKSGVSHSMNNSVVGESGQRIPLSERLAWVTDFQKQPLPADLVRDYIAYAREYCKPKLTSEAAEVLRDYFMELR